MGKGPRGARGGLPSVSFIYLLTTRERGRAREDDRRKGREGQPNLGSRPLDEVLLELKRAHICRDEAILALSRTLVVPCERSYFP